MSESKPSKKFKRKSKPRKPTVAKALEHKFPIQLSSACFGPIGFTHFSQLNTLNTSQFPPGSYTLTLTDLFTEERVATYNSHIPCLLEVFIKSVSTEFTPLTVSNLKQLPVLSFTISA